MANIEKELAQAEAEFQAQYSKLQEAHEKKKAQLLSKAREDFAKAFEAALESFNAIPTEARRELWKDEKISKVLDSYQLKPWEVKPPRKGKRVTDEQILAFLPPSKGTGNVKSHFGLSSLTTLKRLRALEKAGKVKEIKGEGREKVWQKV